MSLAISAVSATNAQHDPEPALKPTVEPAVKLALKPAVEQSLKPAVKPALKPTELQQIEQLSIQGRTAQQIATTVGLPESQIEIDLGTTSSSSSLATSQASALLALGARLSVQA